MYYHDLDSAIDAAGGPEAFDIQRKLDDIATCEPWNPANPDACWRRIQAKQDSYILEYATQDLN